MFDLFKEVKKAKSNLDKVLDFVETAENIHTVVKVTNMVIKELNVSSSNTLQVDEKVAVQEALGIEKLNTMTNMELFKEFERYALDLSDDYWVNNYEEYAKWYREMKKRTCLRIRTDIPQINLNYWDALDEKIENEIQAESIVSNEQIDSREMPSKDHFTIYDRLCIKFDSFHFFAKFVICIFVCIIGFIFIVTFVE